MSEIVKKAFGELRKLPLKKRMSVPIELTIVDILNGDMSKDEIHEKIISVINETIDEWENDGRP